MRWTRRFAEQLARPHGWVGQALGTAMDLANRKPTRLAVDLLAPSAGERVLDAGCGTGAAMAEALRRAPCHATGIDPSRTMLRAAERRLSGTRFKGRTALRHAGLEHLPFADGSFDAALILNVLYFCDADGRMIANLRRALKPGGRLVAYVTHRDTMKDWSFAREGVHRLFDETELVDALAAGGFARERIWVHGVPITRSVLGLLAHAERDE